MSDLNLAAIEVRAAECVMRNGYELRDAYESLNDDVPALVAEVRRLMALVPQPAPPGVVIVSWSGKRHIALPGSRVQRDRSKRALCSEYTWGLEPDADGDVLRGVKEGKRAEILPMCKSCTRLAAS